MKNRNGKKRKRTGFKQGGIQYAAAVIWIIITCFVKHFRRNTSYLFRRCVVAAVICVMAVVAILFVETSHSSMELEETHLVLYMSQKENVVEEGYEHPVVCELVLENDGGNDLTDVRFYIDGQQEGVTLQVENGGEGELLPSGGKWKAKVVMDPGWREGEYFVLVVADACEQEERVEQVIRFVVKAPAESSGNLDTGKSPVPEGTSAPEGTEKPEYIKPDVESGETAVQPKVKPKKTEKPATAAPEGMTGAGKTSKPESGNKPMVTDLPSEKKVQEPVQSEIPMEGKAGDVEGTDDIIRVDVPANARLLMNPMALEENGQIYSSSLPFTNNSDFPLDVEIKSGVLDIRQNGGLVRKDCSLNIDILQEDKVVVAIRNLREGKNPIHTSFCLSPGKTAFMQFFGSIRRGTEYLWRDGDLKASVIFNFRKSEER